MENLYAKMLEYVKMDTEISAGEFSDYYQQVMDKLGADYEKMTEEELFRAKTVTSVMAANAGARGKRKNADAKRFRKIQEKSGFWNDAITYRLKKSGLSEAEIAEKSAALEKELS